MFVSSVVENSLEKCSFYFLFVAIPFRFSMEAFQLIAVKLRTCFRNKKVRLIVRYYNFLAVILSIENNCNSLENSPFLFILLHIDHIHRKGAVWLIAALCGLSSFEKVSYKAISGSFFKRSL